MSSLTTNFCAQVLSRLEQISTGLAAVVPVSPQQFNFEERVLQLTNAIAVKLVVTLPAPALGFNVYLLATLRAIALKLGNSVSVPVPTNCSRELLSQLEQILLGFGGTVPDIVNPSNFEERVLQLLGAIVVSSNGYGAAPPSRLNWSAQNSGSYSYDPGDTMALISNGKIYGDNTSSGLTIYSQSVFIHVRLDLLSATLSSISLHLGQWNGVFNVPTFMGLYEGFVTSVGTPIYSTAVVGYPAATYAPQSFTLPGSISGRDFTVHLTTPDGAISLYELELYGVA